MNNTEAVAEEGSFRVNNTPSITINPTESDQTDPYEQYKSELSIWIQRAVSYGIFFIILQITIYVSISFEPSLIPLFLLDLKIIISIYSKRNQIPIYRLILNKDLISQFTSISFKTMIIFLYVLKPFNSVFLVIPLAVFFVNQLIHKPSKSDECRYFSWMIITVSELLFMIFMVNVTLGLEGIIDWEPSGFLWPIYIGICFCGVICVGLVLFAFGSFLSWASEEIPLSEFFSSIWLLYTVLGATLSLIILCMKLVKDSKYHIEKNYCIFPIVFLFIFSIVTRIFIKPICIWWHIFFSDIPQDENMNVPLPEAVIRTEMTFQSRITNSIKKAPHVLMRISSSYFKPVDTPKGNIQKRTFSMISKVDENCAKVNETSLDEHKRHNSIPLKMEIMSPSARKAINKICEMCCERLCNAVVMDCGHGGICYDCSLELWKTNGNCHMCRGVISQVLQIEKSGEKLVKVHSSTRAVYHDVEVK